MNTFDQVIIEFILRHFSRSYHLFYIVEFMSDDDLLKGGVFAVLVWYLWFKTGPADSAKRVQLLATLISVFVVILVALSLAGIAPFRQRPFLNPQFHFSFLIPVNEVLTYRSSFPSDHAALFVSLATGFLYVSRKVGVLALLYTFTYVFFPRLYLGYHYPTDLLSGALIGASITIFFNRSAAIKNIISKWIIPFSKNYPAYFYSLLFLVTYQIADVFWSSREIVTNIHHLFKHHFHG
jgi:undecaprenyl-diphosphatase